MTTKLGANPVQPGVTPASTHGPIGKRAHANRAKDLKERKEPSGTNKGDHPSNGGENNPSNLILSEADKADRARCEETIRRYTTEGTDNFHKLAAACYEIQQKKLWRDEYRTQEAYFKAKFGYSRSHAHRLAQMGGVLARLSPAGDIVQHLSGDAHLRPLLKLTPTEQDSVLSLAKEWATMAGQTQWPAKLIEAAGIFLHPSTEPKDPGDSQRAKLAAEFHEAVMGAKFKLPPETGPLVVSVFEKLAQQALALGGPRRSTGIEWTSTTWNPLHGCSPKSKGCDRCYAAKLAATRLADVYPGLAKEVVKHGKKSFVFTGTISLAPEDLAEPLKDRVPKRWFVNSMSDLFHAKVPDAFISAVFDVMEKAHWHTFQVLTKRPERMAQFTQNRYRDQAKAPPANIWLGTSCEDQEAYDERNAHLKATVAAVRWLSLEPLLGPLQLGDLKGVHWVVVGGESDSDRRMEKAWVLSLRDQCKAAGVPFFFKQWGDFNEAGEKVAKKQKKNGHGAALDGVVYQGYPDIYSANKEGRARELAA